MTTAPIVVSPQEGTLQKFDPAVHTTCVGMSDADAIGWFLDEKHRLEQGVEKANDHQMVEEWLGQVSPTSSVETVRTYRRHMESFREALRGSPFEQPREYLLAPGPTALIEAWAMGLRAQVQDGLLAVSTYNVAMACIGSFFKWASQPNRRARTGIPLNPVPSGLQLKKMPQRAKSLSLEQLAEVRTGARKAVNSASAARDEQIIRLVYLLGTRATETVNLRWSDLEELENGPAIHIRAETAKGRKERWISIHQPVLDVLERLREVQPESPWLLPNLKHPERHISRQGLWKLCKRSGELAGMPKGTVFPHALRHTHATVSYAKTKDVKLVQQTLGHSDPGVTLNMYVDQLNGDSSTKHLE